MAASRCASDLGSGTEHALCNHYILRMEVADEGSATPQATPKPTGGPRFGRPAAAGAPLPAMHRMNATCDLDDDTGPAADVDAGAARAAASAAAQRPITLDPPPAGWKILSTPFLNERSSAPHFQRKDPQHTNTRFGSKISRAPIFWSKISRAPILGTRSSSHSL